MIVLVNHIHHQFMIPQHEVPTQSHGKSIGAWFPNNLEPDRGRTNECLNIPNPGSCMRVSHARQIMLVHWEAILGGDFSSIQQIVGERG